MRALTWQGTRNVTVETVPDPSLQYPDDAIIEVTSTAIRGSDDLVTHRVPLAAAPEAYAMLQQKTERCIKVVLDPLI